MALLSSPRPRIAQTQFSRKTIYSKSGVASDNMKVWGQQHQAERKVLRGLLNTSGAAGRLQLNLGRINAASPSVSMQSIFVRTATSDRRIRIQHWTFARF